MKHAFLIIAHNEFEILQRLLSALDDERIDFYVHIDKKVKKLPELHVKNAGLFVLDRRVDVRWGHVSQIECEYALFNSAYHMGKYFFYHLISGVHFPLKTVNEILDFYEAHSGKIVFNKLCKDRPWQDEIKIQRINLFIRHYAYGPIWYQHLCQKLWRTTNNLQKRLKVRLFGSQELFKATNWVSYTEESIKFLIDREKLILRKYRWSFCGDEYFAPTELMASSLKSTIFNSEVILYQVFGPASPRILEMADYDAIVSSGCLFGRKFSSLHSDIIDKIEASRL